MASVRATPATARVASVVNRKMTEWPIQELYERTGMIGAALLHEPFRQRGGTGACSTLRWLGTQRLRGKLSLTKVISTRDGPALRRSPSRKTTRGVFPRRFGARKKIPGVVSHAHEFRHGLLCQKLLTFERLVRRLPDPSPWICWSNVKYCPCRPSQEGLSLAALCHPARRLLRWPESRHLKMRLFLTSAVTKLHFSGVG